MAYGDIFVSLDCDDAAPSARPSSTSDAESRRLRLSRGRESQLQLTGNLEHKTGDFWLVFVALEDVPEIVQACLRVRFQVDPRGIVSHIAVDMRLEGEDGPLVEFERV